MCPINGKGGGALEKYFARQPIFDLRNNTYAYELLYRNTPSPEPCTEENGDKSTADVISSSFFGGEPSVIFNGKRAFVNFTEKLILSRTALLLPNDILVVEILETVPASDEVIEACRELKSEGYMIALDDYVFTPETEAFLEVADIAKIDFLNTPTEDIERTAAACRERKVKILGEKIETEEKAEYAKSLGAVYLQGYFFERPIVITNRNCTPMQLTFFRLASIMIDDRVEFRDIAEIVELDAAMTVKLLRLVNSLRNDYTEKIASVFQAVKMLGLKRTREWVYLMGFQQFKNDAPDEVITQAFFRARFCESIGRRIYSARKHAKELYLMGLMSVISVISPDGKDGIKGLNVSDNIRGGLSGEGGIFSDIFEVVVAYERADWDKVDGFIAQYGISEEFMAKDYVRSLKATETLINAVKGR